MKIILLVLLFFSAEALASKNCGFISDGKGKKINIPCKVNNSFKKTNSPPENKSIDNKIIAPKISAPNENFKERQKKYKTLINDIATAQAMESALIHAVISVESAYNPEALSPKGAIGLMQLMPGTASDLQVNPQQIESNIEGGTRYLKEQLARFKRLDLALAAYNAGPQNVEQYQGIPPFAETRTYVAKVLAYYQRYRNEWKDDIL